MNPHEPNDPSPGDLFADETFEMGLLAHAIGNDSNKGQFQRNTEARFPAGPLSDRKPRERTAAVGPGANDQPP